MEKRLSFQTASAAETKRVAKWLAKDLAGILFHDHALVLALSGDLGGGKTTFIQGFAKGLGIRDTIQSPTFLISRIYAIPKSAYRTLIHIDAYRLENPEEIKTLGWNDWLKDRRTIILVEWAKNIEKLLPKIHFDIHFEFVSVLERKITINAEGI